MRARARASPAPGRVLPNLGLAGDGIAQLGMNGARYGLRAPASNSACQRRWTLKQEPGYSVSVIVLGIYRPSWVGWY